MAGSLESRRSLSRAASGSYKIDKATTTTTLTSSPASPQQFGTDVTFTGTVKVGTAAVTEGQVKFYDDGTGSDTCTSLGAASQIGTAQTVDGTGKIGRATSRERVETPGVGACYQRKD